MYQRLFSVSQKKKEPVFLKADSGSLISPQERLPKRNKSHKHCDSVQESSWLFWFRKAEPLPVTASCENLGLDCLLAPVEIPSLPPHELLTGDPHKPPSQASPPVTFDSRTSRCWLLLPVCDLKMCTGCDQAWQKSGCPESTEVDRCFLL